MRWTRCRVPPRRVDEAARIGDRCVVGSGPLLLSLSITPRLRARGFFLKGGDMRQTSSDHYRLNLARPKMSLSWNMAACALIGAMAFAAGAFDIGMRLLGVMGY